MSVSEWYQKREGAAEHLVYLNSKAKELENLLNGTKTMIIRGAAGRKSPLGGRAKVNDIIYFVETGGDLIVKYRGIITEVIESEKMTPEESRLFLDTYASQLMLTPEQDKRWNGKRYLAVYEIGHIEEIEAFTYRRDSNMDDWIITDNIDTIKAS